MGLFNLKKKKTKEDDWTTYTFPLYLPDKKVKISCPNMAEYTEPINLQMERKEFDLQFKVRLDSDGKRRIREVGFMIEEDPTVQYHFQMTPIIVETIAGFKILKDKDLLDAGYLIFGSNVDVDRFTDRCKNEPEKKLQRIIAAELEKTEDEDFTFLPLEKYGFHAILVALTDETISYSVYQKKNKSNVTIELMTKLFYA